MIQTRKEAWSQAKTQYVLVEKTRVEDRKRLKSEMLKHTEKIADLNVELRKVEGEIELENVDDPPEVEGPVTTDDEEAGKRQALGRWGERNVFDPANELKNLPPMEAEKREARLNSQLPRAATLQRLAHLAKEVEDALKVKRVAERSS
jgi:hypothetical protein